MATMLKKHCKSPFPALNVSRRNEPVATDTVYSDTPAINNGSINHSLRWAKPSGTDFVSGYGLAWGGGNRIYLGQFLYNSPNNTSAAQYLLSDNGNSGTSTLVATYTGSFSSNRGCAIDYKNRKLVLDYLYEHVGAGPVL